MKYCTSCDFDYEQPHLCTAPGTCLCELEICDKSSFVGRPRWKIGARKEYTVSPVSCWCDGPQHTWSPGWCPEDGPVNGEHRRRVR